MSSCSQPPTIVFDAVGTLIYARPAVADVYHQYASRCGWTGTVAQIKERFAIVFSATSSSSAPHFATNEGEQKLRWRSIVGRVFEHLPSETVDAIFSRLWDHFAEPQAWEIYPDALAALDLCEKQGIAWCIGSNFDARLLRVVAGHSQLKVASRIFCSSQVGFDKPSTQFFRHIECELSLDPSRLIMIGDDQRLDVQAAHAAGWTGRWIDRTDPSQQLHQLILT